MPNHERTPVQVDRQTYRQSERNRIDKLVKVNPKPGYPLLGESLDVGRFFAARDSGDKVSMQQEADRILSVSLRIAPLPDHAIEYHRLVGTVGTIKTFSEHTGRNVPVADKLTALALERASRFTRHAQRLTDPTYAGRDRYNLTGKHPESIFRIAIHETMLVQEPIDQSALALTELSTENPLFTEHLKRLTKNFATMGASLWAVTKNVPIEFFTFELRPFFGSIQVGDEILTHTAAQNSGPLFVDPIIGIVTPQDMKDFGPCGYGKYHEENMKYLLKKDIKHFKKAQKNLGGSNVLNNLFGSISGFDVSAYDQAESMRVVYKQAPASVQGTMQAFYGLVEEIDLFRKMHIANINRMLAIIPYSNGTGGMLRIPFYLQERTSELKQQLEFALS